MLSTKDKTMRFGFEDEKPVTEVKTARGHTWTETTYPDKPVNEEDLVDYDSDPDTD